MILLLENISVSNSVAPGALDCIMIHNQPVCMIAMCSDNQNPKRAQISEKVILVEITENAKNSI